MSCDVHIAAADCISCFGFGRDRLWQSLMNSECGFSEIDRFTTVNYVNSRAAMFDELNRVKPGDRFPYLLHKLPIDADYFRGRTGVLTATTKDNIELLEMAERDNRPIESSDSICRLLDARLTELGLEPAAPIRNINAACASATTAIIMAAAAIRRGDFDTFIIYSADIVSEFVFSGFSALKAMTETQSMPFDINRSGLMLGEAAGFVVLKSESQMKRESLRSLAKVDGWAISSDATHITAPDREARGLIAAMGEAVAMAGLTACDISAISAHGTGTVFNDAMEAVAIENVFGKSPPPVFSIKGAIGHTLGVSGLIEVIVSADCLREQVIPPTLGVQTPEPAVSGSVMPVSQKIDGEYMLSTNSGFGGVNAAVVLSRGAEL